MIGLQEPAHFVPHEAEGRVSLGDWCNELIVVQPSVVLHGHIHKALLHCKGQDELDRLHRIEDGGRLAKSLLKSKYLPVSHPCSWHNCCKIAVVQFRSSSRALTCLLMMDMRLR